MFEAAQPQVAANPVSLCARKTAWSEGSLAKPNLPFFYFLFFGEAKKTRSPKEDEFLRSKNEPSLEGFVLTKLKQDLCKRACFYAAKQVPRAGMERKGNEA